MAIQKFLPVLQNEFSPDFLIANGENAAGGLGITRETATFLFRTGLQCLTMGNHVWNKKEALGLLESEDRIIRPANYPVGAPGMGWRVIESEGKKLGVLNLLGRAFMEPLDSPFFVGDSALNSLKEEIPCILVDFHAEATSEKIAFGRFADSRASVVLGTHTHVQTSDEKILPGGTAYITDVGMTGPYDSILGMECEAVLQRMIHQLPKRFEVADGPEVILSGVVVDLDEETGTAQSIERFQRIETIL